MGDWFIATEGVKIVKDSPGLWPQIITAVASIGAALGGVGLTHRFTRKREQAAAEQKLAGERYFIATELVFKLEDFAEMCAEVSQDDGRRDEGDEFRPTVSVYSLEFDDVTGDWRALPPPIMSPATEVASVCCSRRSARVLTGTASAAARFFRAAIRDFGKRRFSWLSMAVSCCHRNLL